MNPPIERSGLSKLSDAISVIAVIIGVIAVIVGIALAAHTDTSGYYDDASHPYEGIGAAVLIGGVLQALFTLLVARTCAAVADIRDAVKAGGK